MATSPAHHAVFAVVANFAATPPDYAGFDGRLLLERHSESELYADPLELEHAKREWHVEAADTVRSICVTCPEAARTPDFLGYDVGWFDPEHGQYSLILNYGLSRGSATRRFNRHLLFDAVEEAESLLLEWQLWQPEDGDKEVFQNAEILEVLAIFDRSANETSVAAVAANVGS